MLDINFIKNNLEIVKDKAKEKGVEVDVDRVLSAYEARQQISRSVQTLREERNKAVKEKDIEKGKEIKNNLDKEESALKDTEIELDQLVRGIPNLPLDGVPSGSEDDFEEIKKVGEVPKFDFEVRDHVDIGKDLDIIDIERATKVSGSRFVYLKNEGVLLELALVQFALSRLVEEGFSPVIPPVLIKSEITEKLGYWNEGNQNNYYHVTDYEEAEEGKETENPLYLVGTGEHSVVPMHQGETFNASDLPKKYAAFSPCFRREAGSYGKDTKGILRVHQFDKVEMVELVRPEDDEKERNKMLEIAEGLMSDLGLSYRVIKLAAGDIAFPTAQTIDIETWIPSQGKYRETHSISTTTDFQSRRLGIKYKDQDENKYVHILNGTAFAIGRTLIAILENYQQSDGSVVVPEVLQKYTGFDKVEKK